MKNKDNKMKISIITIILIVVVVVVLIVLALNSKDTGNDSGNNNIPSITDNPTSTIKPTATGSSNIWDNKNLATEFDFDFLRLENDKKNMLYSPLSIKFALKMVYEGAEGNTKAQINNLLKNSKLVIYKNIDKALSFANATYIKDTYEEYVKEEFKNTLVNKYNAELKIDQFKNAANMNKWIEEKTLGIIKDMIADEAIQEEKNKMVLINALAIDMEWENKFDEKNTYGDRFYLADGKEMEATTMHKTTASDEISYYKDDDITAVALDLKQYDNTQLQFVAIMPKDNLDDYVERMSVSVYDNILDNLKGASSTKAGVRLSIPKFAFDYDLSLKEDLKKLGVTDAFDENLADFSGMTNKKEGLYISEILHKADIAFTEKGTKAAAVTVVMMFEANAIAGEQEKPVDITIDKPFMFVIRNKANGDIWFTGTVYNPNSWEKDKASYEPKY